MTVAQEEIFGPVTVLMPYHDEEEAIRIANDTSFGLAGTVFTADVMHGFEIARRIRPAPSRSTPTCATSTARSAATSSPGSGARMAWTA